MSGKQLICIIDYSDTIFRRVGLSSHSSDIIAGLLQLWFFIASFIPWFLIDRLGRRPLVSTKPLVPDLSSPSIMTFVLTCKKLLSMITLMAVVMGITAALVYQVQFSPSIAHAAGIAAVVMLFIFQGAYTIGFQATVWVYCSEILPLRLRHKGSSISTAANWIFTFIVVQITPIAIASIGWRTWIIFGVLNVSER